MRAAEPRLEPAGQILVGEDGVEMHGRLGNAHALAAGRDAGMEIGQRLGIIEPVGLGHEALDQRQHAIGSVDEAIERHAPVGAIARAALIEPALGPRGVLGWRQPEQRQEIPALEMRAFFLELSASLGVDEARGGVGKLVARIGVGGLTLRLDEDRPAGPQAAQGVVEPPGDRDELGGRRRIQIGTAEPRGALERAVLVEDDALLDQRRPGQEVGEALRPAAIFGEVHHRGALTRSCAGGSAGAGAPRRRRRRRAWRPRPPRDGRSAR